MQEGFRRQARLGALSDLQQTREAVFQAVWTPARRGVGSVGRPDPQLFEAAGWPRPRAIGHDRRCGSKEPRRKALWQLLRLARLYGRCANVVTGRHVWIDQ